MSEHGPDHAEWYIERFRRMAAEVDHPGPQWLIADLAELDLAGVGESEPFDAAVLAGNVLAFVAEDTESVVLDPVARHLRPGAFVAVELGLERGYPLAAMDTDTARAGLRLELRFATWDLQPFGPEATFAVSIYRRPDTSSADPIGRERDRVGSGDPGPFRGTPIPDR